MNLIIFIEKYNNLKNNFFKYNVCEEIIESYENLPQLYKDALKSSLLDCANKSVISAIDSKDLTPYWLSHQIIDLGDWILESTKQKVKEYMLNKIGLITKNMAYDNITTSSQSGKSNERGLTFGTKWALQNKGDTDGMSDLVTTGSDGGTQRSNPANKSWFVQTMEQQLTEGGIFKQ